MKQSSRVSLPGVFHSDFDVFPFVPFCKLRVIWVSYLYTIINGQSKYSKFLTYEWVPFKEQAAKANLFITSTKLAHVPN